MDATRYSYEDINSVMARVLISQPRGSGTITVYVPPIGPNAPYTVPFENMDEAELFATQAQRDTPFAGRAVLLTHDVEKWWLTNLAPIDDIAQQAR